MSNWHDRRFTDAHWDHERDLRKHEPRPTDRIPLRLETAPLSTAMDIALCVRGMDNLQAAAALIEQFAAAQAAADRLDAVAAGARP